MLRSETKKLILLAGDIVLLYAGLALTLYLRYDMSWFPASPTKNAWELHKMPFLLVHTLWVFIFYSAGMYDWERFTPRRISLVKLVFKSMAAGTAIAVLFFYFIPAFNITPKTNLIIDALVVAVFLSLWRIVFLKAISKSSKIKIVFFGSTVESNAFKRHLDASPSLGYKVEAVIEHSDASINLKHLILERGIDLVVTVSDISGDQKMLKLFYEAIPLGVTITDFPKFYESIMGKVPVSVINESWFLENLFELDKRTFEGAKRVVDIVASLTLSIPMLVLFIPITTAIVLSTPRDIWHYKERRARTGDGIIFFKQPRVGKNGKVFYFIKFRSQVLGAEQMGEIKELKEDRRQYTVGKFLRKTYLDELPQILNILRGEMSLVGPRPERPEYVENLKKQIPFYEIRLLVKPGITGWAQINMKNDASVEDAPEKLQYDLYYIKNRSLLGDLAIMAKTATILASRSGR